jgi:glucuronate isomerase
MIEHLPVMKNACDLVLALHIDTNRNTDADRYKQSQTDTGTDPQAD